MYPSLWFLFILLGVLSLPSCGLFKNKKQIVISNPNVRLSGRVQSVNEEAKFVLIRRYGPWKVGDGQVVESRGDNRTANLMPTGEKLGEHIAADIRNGEVEVGDAVYIRRLARSDPKDLATTSEGGNIDPVLPSLPTPQNAPPTPGSDPISKPSTKPDIPEEPEDQL